MPLTDSLAKATSSFLLICIYLFLTLNRVIYDKQLHKIRYSLTILCFSQILNKQVDVVNLKRPPQIIGLPHTLECGVI